MFSKGKELLNKGIKGGIKGIKGGALALGEVIEE